ncbi:MAG: ERCC4 domain-containing protein [Pseudomonadota bacterium]
MPKPVTILADDRETGSDVIEALMRHAHVSVSVQRLAMGDYQVDERLVFERKTLGDFAVSVIDGRLFRQCIKMATASMIPVLILEGSGANIAGTGVRREALQGALITVSLVLGVPVLRARNPAETAHLMLMAARQINAVARGTVQRNGYRPKGKRRRQLYILQGLPGIGPARAQRLLDHFGSVASAIAATPEQWAAVDGIGKTIAGKIKWIISEQWSDYGYNDINSL